MDYLKCVHCSKMPSDNKPFSICSVCKLSHYCSKECQKNDWSLHKSQCSYNESLHMITMIRRFMYDRGNRCTEFRVELDMMHRLKLVPVIAFRHPSDIQEFISCTKEIKGVLRSTSLIMDILGGDTLDLDRCKNMIVDGYLFIIVHLDNIDYPVYISKMKYPHREYVAYWTKSTPAIRKWVKYGGSVRYLNDVEMTDDIAISTWTMGILRKGKEKYGMNKESVVKVINILVEDIKSIDVYLQKYLRGDSVNFSIGDYKFILE